MAQASVLTEGFGNLPRRIGLSRMNMRNLPTKMAGGVFSATGAGMGFLLSPSSVAARYLGPAAFSLATPFFGDSATTAMTGALGFMGSQLAFDIASKVGNPVGRGISSVGRAIGRARPNSMLPGIIGGGTRAMGSALEAISPGGRSIMSMTGKGIQAAGRGLSNLRMPSLLSLGTRGAGAVVRKAWGPLMIGSFVGLMFPEKHPIREAADYLTGLKAADYMSESIERVRLERIGGFGLNTKPTSNARTIKAREIAKALMGVPNDMSFLGQEASYMHN